MENFGTIINNLVIQIDKFNLNDQTFIRNICKKKNLSKTQIKKVHALNLKLKKINAWNKQILPDYLYSPPKRIKIKHGWTKKSKTRCW